jgi:TonB family protein
LRRMFSAVVTLYLLAAANSIWAQASIPGMDQNSAASAATPDPKALDNLKQQIDEIFKALKAKQKDQFHKLVNDLRMPDEQSWFLKVFGTEMGRNMAERYADEWPRFEEDLEMRLKTDHDDKRTDISPHEATDPVFPGASQIAAIMKTPTVLYAVSASKHGKEEWNLSGVFVADNGSFRCIPPSVFAMVPGTKPGRIRIGGNVQRPKVVKSVPPIYPQEARLAHVTGTVVLHVIIGSDGSVQEVSYVSGPMPLSSAAADAVHQWRFEVTRLNDMPVEVDTTIPVTFSISY